MDAMTSKPHPDRDEDRDERRRRLEAEYAAAAADPVFMAELRSEAALWDETSSDGLAHDS